MPSHAHSSTQGIAISKDSRASSQAGAPELHMNTPTTASATVQGLGLITCIRAAAPAPSGLSTVVSVVSSTSALAIFQPSQLSHRAPLQPSSLAISGRILGRRFAVMHLARLDQDDLARHAVIALPPAMKTLHALLGKADQIGVVPMRVLGVPSK